LVILQGCSTPNPPATSRARPVAAAPAAPAPAASSAAGSTAPAQVEAAAAGPRTPVLVVERQWLQSWFNGTPVRIAQQGSGPVAIDVPQAFCFDSGRSSVKPPLAAVLDKLALSLRRHPGVRLPLLAAPSDSAPAAGTAPTAPLALQRAAQMRSHLLQRGVQAAQLGPPTATRSAAAQMRLELAGP
jgi:outer membrane protein OmpA-like peptidoglycan-associated protein